MDESIKLFLSQNGRKGGQARNKKLSAKRRTEIAKKANAAMQAKRKQRKAVAA